MLRRKCPECLEAPEGQKHCHGTCGLVKPLDEFHNDKSSSDGKNGQCKECSNRASKEYKDRKIAEDPTYRQTRFISWHSTHPEKLAQYRADWNERNPGLQAEYSKRWRAENPDRIRLYGGLRRARKYGVEYEPISYEILFERDQGICQECFEPVDPNLSYLNPETGLPDRGYGTTGHIVNLSQGGPHTYANTQLEHLGCNLDKARHRNASEEEIKAIFYADRSASVRAFWMGEDDIASA